MQKGDGKKGEDTKGKSTSDAEIEELEEEAFLRGVPEHEIVIAKTAIWGEKTPNNDPNDPDAGERYWRAPEFVVPDLTGFELKPYVSRNVRNLGAGADEIEGTQKA